MGGGNANETSLCGYGESTKSLASMWRQVFKRRHDSVPTAIMVCIFA